MRRYAFGTINGTGSRIFCPDVKGMWGKAKEIGDMAIVASAACVCLMPSSPPPNPMQSTRVPSPKLTNVSLRHLSQPHAS